MQANTTAVERAFELARSGACISIVEIKKRLNAEGYSNDVIMGRQLLAQLKAVIEKARGRHCHSNALAWYAGAI
jgi:hypothetical protein